MHDHSHDHSHSNSMDCHSLMEAAKKARKYVLDQIYAAGSGHPGGSLSCIEILCAIFLHQIRPEGKWTEKADRDHVILSKGHAAPALYAVLALSGLIEEKDLLTLRQLGSALQGHPDRSRLPEAEMSTGSLGQGLSVGLGQAMALELMGSEHFAYVVLGDGEMNSGQIWEAIAYAGGHRAGKLIAILDANGIQNDGFSADILDMRPYEAKLAAFGWAVQTIDGQSMREVAQALEWATGQSGQSGQGSQDANKPKFIVAQTRKGAGVSFMEDQIDWHSHSLSEEQYQDALAEVLGGSS